MVSWDKSMAAAFNVIVYSIIWGIIGTLLILIGLGMMGSQMANIPGVFTTGKAPDLAIILPLIITVIGYVVLICGFLASFMKVLTELIVEEFDES